MQDDRDAGISTVRRVLLAGCGVHVSSSRRELYPQQGMGSPPRLASGPRPIPDPGRRRRRRHREGPFRPVQTAGRCPRLHVDAQGHYRPSRRPPRPIQRQAWHLPTLPQRAREPGGAVERQALTPHSSAGPWRSWASGSSSPTPHRPRAA